MNRAPSVPPLPPGWERCFDPKSGRTYYQNHQTKSTQWDPPVAPAVAPLPEGWTESFDPVTKRSYYSNHLTKTTQWERPVAPAASLAPLPRGWVMLTDAKTGRPYYSSHVLKKTQWERPVDDDMAHSMSGLNIRSASSPRSSAPSAPSAPSFSSVPSFHQAKHDAAVTPQEMYQNVLRAVLIDGRLNKAEEIMLSQLREKHNISIQEHETMLRSMGVDPSKVHDDEAEAKGPSAKECVVCLDNTADHIVMDCMHICVCADCAGSLKSKPSNTCPVCRAPIRDIKKVFL